MCYVKNLKKFVKARKKTFLCPIILILTLLIIFTAVAETAETEEPSNTSQPTNAERAKILKGGLIPFIGFNKEAGIRGALRFLAATCEINIVPSSKVDGELTFSNLYNVTFDEAMYAILGDDFKYKQVGNIIRIYTSDDKNRMAYKLFTLYYTSAAEVKRLIDPVLSVDGKVESTTPAQTGVPTDESIGRVSGGGDTMATKDTIVVYDYPENLADAEAIIKETDIRPKQVLVEAAILSVTLTDTMQLGFDWQTLKGSAVSGLGNLASGASDFFKSAGSGVVSTAGGMTVGFAHDDIAGFIRAVEEITDVTVLAKPKILAVNKQLGQVFIGRKIGYREGDVETAAGGTQQGQVKFLDTGTKLSFRPYIGNDGYIRMDIHPKDSSGGLDANGIPSETSAELVTNLIVKDGETIVIGGLFRDEIKTTKTQIPVLGDIPILGALFSGTSDTVVRREVIILLTPHIIKEPQQAAGTMTEDPGRAILAAKDSLQWLTRTRLAEDRYTKAASYYIEGDTEAAIKELDYVLDIYPTDLKSVRLKEMILLETSPQQFDLTERKIREMIEKINQQY